MNNSEVERMFSTEEQCREYLCKLRWPDGYHCSRCNHDKAWQLSERKYQCKKCGYQSTVITGTIFQDTHMPLTIWFRAIWYVTSQKTGISALGLQKVLGLGSYRTAWTLLHKLRRAMIRPGRDKLQGVIEVDETFVGGVKSGKRGRGSENKVLVAVAVEVKEAKPGRIRIAVIPDASANSLKEFISSTIEGGSIVITDGWRGYTSDALNGYHHEYSVSTGNDNLLSHVHIVASLLKRWLLGTLQGSYSKKHLEYYLDEFMFRFNRRTSKSRGLLFYRLLQNAVQLQPSTYAEITAR